MNREGENTESKSADEAEAAKAAEEAATATGAEDAATAKTAEDAAAAKAAEEAAVSKADEVVAPKRGADAICAEAAAAAATVRTAKRLGIFLTAIVIIGIGLMTTFATQTWPFSPDWLETCDLVDEVSDTLGAPTDANAPATAKIEMLNKYLANKHVRKAMLVCDIERENAGYGRVGVTNQILSSVGTILVIVLTLATSFILGAGWTASSPNLKAVTVALPLISAALTAMMSEFHVADVWQLREAGRIESRILLDRAFGLDVEGEDFDGKFAAIRNDLMKLERSQAERYFAYKFKVRDEGTPAEQTPPSDETEPTSPGDVTEQTQDTTPPQ